MKRLVIALLMVALAFGVAGARKKKDKAGTIKDGVYLDKTYNFSLPISEDVWNYAVKKDKSAVRMVLTKKVFDIPIDYTRDPGYTKTPKVTVYVGKTDWSAKMFVDSLLSDDYKSDLKKDILHNCCEILFGVYIPKRNSKIQIGDNAGMLISGELQYTNQIPGSSDQSSHNIVTDFYGGAVFLTRHGDNIYIFHMICENKYFAAEYADFTKLLEGLKFSEEEAEKK